MSIPIICREWQTEERPHPPERRLCAAILTVAIEDVLAASTFYEWKERHSEQEQAYWWLFVAREGQTRVSVQLCCQVVEIPVSKVHTWLWDNHHLLMTKLQRKCQRSHGTA